MKVTNSGLPVVVLTQSGGGTDVLRDGNVGIREPIPGALSPCGRSEWNIVRTTVEDENNGLWEVDIETGTKKKLSDECVFDDLLATENYLYCYRKDYLLPRGMANDWYKGYSLKQIPIN